ncbi:MAG: DMT family transporter [Jatrophihabitantaceae bacterium]
MSRRGWLLFAAMSVIWGLPYLFIRVAVEHVTPGTLVFLRTFGAAVVLLPLALARRQIGPVIRRWRPLIAFAAIEVMIPWLLISDAERQLSSSLAGLLVAAVPLIGALVARFSGQADRVTGRQLAGLLLGIAGVAALVGIDFAGLDLFAFVEMAVASTCYAIGPIILTRSLADLPGPGVIAASLTITSVCFLPFVIAAPPRQLPASAVSSMVVLSLLCTALAFVLFFQLIAAIGPTRSTVITYLNPAVALALGVLVLNEEITLGMLVGFPLILAGSILAARKVRAVAEGRGETLAPAPTA